MNKAIHEPLIVTQEAIDAYEKKTGFFGIGKVMVEDGHWKIVTVKEFSDLKKNHRNSTISSPLTHGETTNQGLPSGHYSLTYVRPKIGGKA